MNRKTELRVVPHSVLPGEKVIEMWWQGKMIGTVTGHDLPGVRVISKYPLAVADRIDPNPIGLSTMVNVVSVTIDAT